MSSEWIPGVVAGLAVVLSAVALVSQAMLATRVDRLEQREHRRSNHEAVREIALGRAALREREGRRASGGPQS